jgi:hypothetical protein
MRKNFEEIDSDAFKYCSFFWNRKETTTKTNQDLHVNADVGVVVIIIIIFFVVAVVSLRLQSSVDLGLPHNLCPILSILCLHSPTSDVHHPDVILHVCFPLFY